ncbi:hypothetical protein L596_017410 [Steinernema carpocapsae]|uniref:Uncharacterized protein n=1 Tax=Steinernema carpocapsae TaxID=34508 RepID=A0A4V6A1R6_STECR|nr:hypothetical protein L596_017410 [Steinernema carpocapsae]
MTRPKPKPIETWQLQPIPAVLKMRDAQSRIDSRKQANLLAAANEPIEFLEKLRAPSGMATTRAATSIAEVFWLVNLANFRFWDSAGWEWMNASLCSSC